MNDRRFPTEEDWGEALGDISGPDGLPVPDPEFRERILGRTSRKVRGRRHRAVTLRAVAALLLFASGFALGTDRTNRPESAPEPGTVVTAPPPVAPAGPTVPPDSTVPSDPAMLEKRLARAEPEVRRAEWQRAGDAYLGGDNTDPTSALYCYRQAFEATPDGSTLAVTPEDSWLLKALKADRN